MKKLLLLCLILITSSITAQVVLDTLSSRYVGPGVLYTEILAPKVPWTIQVLRVDLKNKYLSLEAVKSKDTYYGYERTSAISKRKSYDGHVVVGAVNADYYNTKDGSLTNIQIADGQIYRGPVKSTLIGFDLNNKPMMSICTLNSVVFTGGSSLKINEVNQTRKANQMILYNYYKGTSTGTDTAGSEALINPLSAWLVNDTLKCVVEKIEDKIGNMAIPYGKAVLSGNGTAADYIVNNLKAGDTIKLYMGITPGISKIKELIGGHPRLVKEGRNYLDSALNIDKEPGSSTTTPAPRTVAGISKDSTYLYLITMDGRQASSAGAILTDLADLAIRLGAYHAFNLDGGGSTTMVVRNEVMNSPSDGNERSVANCLLVVSSAPSKPDSIGRIGFKYKYDNYKIYSVDRIPLKVYVNDINDNPVTPDLSLMKFGITPGLGTVDKDGLFTAAKTAKSGYIYVEYKGFKDSVYIDVLPINRISLSPKTSVIDATNPLSLTLHGYTSDNIERTISGVDLTWKSSDTSIVVIDSAGIIRGKNEGKAKVIASFLENITDSVDVTVLIGRGTTISDKLDSISTWTISGASVDLSATKLTISNENKSEGTGSFKIDYKYTYDPARSSMVYLNKVTPFYGLPDSLLVDVKSDNTTHDIFLVVANELNKTFKVTSDKDITGADKFSTVALAFKDNSPLNAGTFSFPIKLTRIVINLQYNTPDRVTGQTYSGTIYLDNLRVKYPMDITGVEDGGNWNTPKEYSLKQNYPNPFNPSTVIEFATKEQGNTILKVYDLLGREVAVLVNENLSAGNHKAVWNAAGNPSGIYFYRLYSGNYVETKKMIFVK